MSQMVARWRRIPIAASLREFIISRGRRTRWPTTNEIDSMDEASFERYVRAVGLDKKIDQARDNRQGGSHSAAAQKDGVRSEPD